MLVAGMLAAVLGWLHISIFTFLLIKIITKEQLCQQLVKLVKHICFYFFAYKNDNAGVAIPRASMPAAVLSWLYILIFAFLLVKIII